MVVTSHAIFSYAWPEPRGEYVEPKQKWAKGRVMLCCSLIYDILFNRNLYGCPGPQCLCFSMPGRIAPTPAVGFLTGTDPMTLWQTLHKVLGPIIVVVC
jgi:hypothetical protein